MPTVFVVFFIMNNLPVLHILYTFTTPPPAPAPPPISPYIKISVSLKGGIIFIYHWQMISCSWHLSSTLLFKYHSLELGIFILCSWTNKSPEHSKLTASIEFTERTCVLEHCSKLHYQAVVKSLFQMKLQSTHSFLTKVHYYLNFNKTRRSWKCGFDLFTVCWRRCKLFIKAVDTELQL